MNKYILCIATTVLTLSCSSKINYDIEGSAPMDYEGRMVYLYNLSTEQEIDTTEIKNGKFSFEGRLDQEAMASISATGSVLDFVLEDSKVKLALTNKLQIISGGKLNQSMKNYHEEINKQLSDATKVFEKMFMSKPDSNWISTKSAYITKGFNSRISEIKKNYNINNRFNIIGAYFYYNFIQYRTMNQINRFFKLNAYAKNFERLKRVVNEERNFGKLNIGSKYENFTLKDKNNQNDVKLSSYIGRNNYVLLYVWSTKCEESLNLSNEIEKLRVKYAKEGLYIIGINILDNHCDMEREMLNLEMNWTQLYDSTKYDFEAIYGAHILPYNILIDPKGRIIETELVVNQLDGKLDELFNIKVNM